MVKETQTTRLDRIEDKIDKLSDAIVSLARVEEKIASMEAQLVNGHDRMNKHGIKLDAIESQVQSNAQTVSVIHKVFWIVIVACSTVSSAVWFSVSQALRGRSQYLIHCDVFSASST